LIHEFLLGFIIDAPSYIYNNAISAALINFSIIPIAKTIDFEKLKGSLNLVAVISIIGIVYHFIVIQSGGVVTPIALPFMPAMESTSRLFEEGFRPTSFYWEPAAYVTFMMAPLFVSLLEKKFLWSTIIVASMFLSTSTTGITMSVLLLCVYAVSQNIGIRNKLIAILIGLGFVYLLINSTIFSAGMEKLFDTDIETTSRTYNGIAMVFNMPFSDLILGMPAANPYDYYMAGGFSAPDIVVRDGSIFVSTFWYMLSKYGFMGISLFMLYYLQFVKQEKESIPFVVVIFASMFFQGIPTGSYGFAYQSIVLLSFLNRKTVLE